MPLRLLHSICVGLRENYQTINQSNSKLDTDLSTGIQYPQEVPLSSSNTGLSRRYRIIHTWYRWLLNYHFCKTVISSKRGRCCHKLFYKNADSLSRKLSQERNLKFCYRQEEKNGTVLQNVPIQGDKIQIRLARVNLIKEQNFDATVYKKKSFVIAAREDILV